MAEPEVAGASRDAAVLRPLSLPEHAGAGPLARQDVSPRAPTTSSGYAHDHARHRRLPDPPDPPGAPAARPRGSPSPARAAPAPAGTCRTCRTCSTATPDGRRRPGRPRAQLKTTVRSPLSSTRDSQCQRTARASTRDSTSSPARTRSLGRHPVVDPHDVLLDDRPLVEVRGHVVRGRPDELDAPRERLVVGLGALERRQERVVDVDHPPDRSRVRSSESTCM